VVITGGDAPAAMATTGLADAPAAPHVIDWLLTPHASGWLTAPRVDTRHTHGTGCTFASGVAAALALGHVEADAIVLAKMLTHHALQHGHAAGQGPGPVMARAGFAQGPRHGGAPLPWLGLDETLPWAMQGTHFAPFTAPPDRLYGIVDGAQRVADGVASGLKLLQLRRKTRDALLAHHIRTSLEACSSSQASLFINDHWREALALLAAPPSASSPGMGQHLGIHLGQEDLLALSPADQATLRQHSAQLQLGLSSHSLWELARAAGCGASMIACGPVKPTATKDMPWRPQGTDNLHWWVAHSPAPVVAIGGLLTPDDVAQAARCGPAAVCIVRGLGQTLDETQAALPAFRQAVSDAVAAHGQGAQPGSAALPHPVL
jgi:hydroxymethylpyrimidine kinase/phosphomethylpyrimidine kinase/thiamine-phosphate diphosphorylase